MTATVHRAEVHPGIWADSRLGVWFAAERLLVVADLHWGYAASHRARGNLLPMWSDDEIERRLRSLVTDYAPVEMLWLGDIVHAAEGSARAERFLRESPMPVTVLAGNHDRRWPGAAETTARRGRFFFHHGDVARPVPAGAIEVIGHHHPAYQWTDSARGRVKLSAIVTSPRQLVLPAFSPWAAGTEFAPEAESTLWVIAPNRIFALPSRDRLSAAV